MSVSVHTSMTVKKRKICWLCIAGFTLLGLLFWSLSGCQDTKFKEIESIPIIEEKNNYLTHFNISRHFAYKKSMNWVDTKVPTDIKVFLLDGKYFKVDYYFFKKFNNWFKKLQFENGILPIDQKENLDCDNFAMLYKSLMSVSAYKSSSAIEPAVALLVLEQVKPFGGIPSGGLHMVNLVFTNQGWYVIEPQTGKYILLEKYPNQQYVKYMII